MWISPLSLGGMRELPQRHRHLLDGHRIMVASADRVLIIGLVHSLNGIGSLVGAARRHRSRSPRLSQPHSS